MTTIMKTTTTRRNLKNLEVVLPLLQKVNPPLQLGHAQDLNLDLPPNQDPPLLQKDKKKKKRLNKRGVVHHQNKIMKKKQKTRNLHQIPRKKVIHHLPPKTKPVNNQKRQNQDLQVKKKKRNRISEVNLIEIENAIGKKVPKNIEIEAKNVVEKEEIEKGIEKDRDRDRDRDNNDRDRRGYVTEKIERVAGGITIRTRDRDSFIPEKKSESNRKEQKDHEPHYYSSRNN